MLSSFATIQPANPQPEVSPLALLVVTVKFYQWMAAVIFRSYLLYGFLRPFLSPKRRRVIRKESAKNQRRTEAADQVS